MCLVPYDTMIKAKPYDDAFAYPNNTWVVETYDYEPIILGTYATQERALEVLDEIENASMGKLVISSDPLPNKEHWVYKGRATIQPISKDKIEILPLVYQMPSE